MVLKFGRRTAVLAVLTARAEGRNDPVAPEHGEWFEKQVAAESLPDTALLDLAAARATAIQQQLAHDHGVASGRIVLDDASATNAAARPVVTIGLGSVTPTVAAQP